MSKMTVSAAGVTLPCHFSEPESSRGPGVIVLQEWWGLVPHIEAVADRFARAGFLALAPDLYHGRSTRSPDEAGKLMMALDIEKTQKELDATISFLKKHPHNSTGRVGIVGFCMGGALSLYAATHNRDLSACVVFYGGHPKVVPDYASLSAPVLGLYGGKDRSVTPASARELERKLKELGKSVEVHIYPDAGHAFFNDERPEVYNSEAADDAWRRSIDFFRAHLS